MRRVMGDMPPDSRKVPADLKVEATETLAKVVRKRVTFAVTSGGGSITGASQTTASNGIASVGSWTLGSAVATNTLTATAAGLSGSPVTFTASGTASGGVTRVATTSVSLINTAFVPPDIRVSPGATVTFTNNDGIQHNVTFANSGIVSTGNFASGPKNVVMPVTPGTYTFQCTIHGGMAGSVLVQ